MTSSSHTCFFINAIHLIGICIVFISCEPEIIVNEIPTYKTCTAKPAPLYLPGDMLKGRVAGLKNCLPFVASAYAYVSDDSTKLIGLGINTY